MRKKKMGFYSTNFQDSEENNISIHYSPEYKQFSVSITDGHGERTNSIEMGYEDLRSLFKEAENIFFQHEGLIDDERSFPKPNTED